MPMYYLRWPNGQHTLAVAPGRYELWCMLDEDADAADAEVLVKQLRRTRFALDFKDPEFDEEHEGAPWESCGFSPQTYESSCVLIEECTSLPDQDLKSGAEFFKDVHKRYYGDIDRSLDRRAKEQVAADDETEEGTA